MTYPYGEYLNAAATRSKSRKLYYYGTTVMISLIYRAWKYKFDYFGHISVLCSSARVALLCGPPP